ncbi:MAG: hypothetical protein OXG44_12840, partial [Gammaproteobacteria bacterium]|nr:hypothetical protein [Gammaproteobacteria bacterium]
MNTGTGEIQTDADTRESMDPLIAGTGQTNWASDNLDLYNQRFSEIDQIDTANVGQLQGRWSYEAAPGLYVGQNTPLVVDRVMYFHAGGALQVAFAIDGRLSEEHETAFARVRGPEETKLFGGLHERDTPPEMAQVLGKDLYEQVHAPRSALA